jgi:hypothetical protein
MQQHQRDRSLLGALAPTDRAKIEEVVDDIIEECLFKADPASLYGAARSFETHSELMAEEQKILAMQLAAALRVRASEVITRN